MQLSVPDKLPQSGLRPASSLGRGPEQGACKAHSHTKGSLLEGAAPESVTGECTLSSNCKGNFQINGSVQAHTNSDLSRDYARLKGEQAPSIPSRSDCLKTLTTRPVVLHLKSSIYCQRFPQGGKKPKGFPTLTKGAFFTIGRQAPCR